MFRPLCRLAKIKTVPVEWENDETRNRSGRLEEEKQLLPVLGFEPLIVQLVFAVAIPNELSRLPNPGMIGACT